MNISPTLNDRRSSFPSTLRSGAGLLLILGLCAYLNAIGHPFVHDDWVFIVGNSELHRWDNIGEIFFRLTSPEGLSLANPYYRPLLEIFSRIEYQIFGLNPYGYHFVNVLIHLANGVLLFFLLDGLLARRSLSWCAALLFVLHPVQSEAVAAVAGISNLLYTAVVLSAWLAYRRAEKFFYALSVGIYAPGLLVKEQVIILPVLLLLGELLFPVGGKGGGEAVRKIVPFLIVTAAYLFWRKIISGTAVTAWNGSGELLLRLAAIPQTLLMDWRIVLFPHDLHYYRSVDILQPSAMPAVILLGVLAAAGLLLRRMAKDSSDVPDGPAASLSRCAVFGLGFFLITILPVLNILPLIHEYSYIAAFEHFLYLPLAGLLIFWAAVVSFLLEKIQAESSRRAVAAAMVAVVASVSLAATIHQNTFWRGDVPLFENALRYEPGLGRVHLLLGKAYYQDEQYPKAVEELQAAAGIMESYLTKVTNPEARSFYLGILKESRAALGHCLLATGDRMGALILFQQALELSPDDAAIHNDIGAVYIQLNNFEKGCEHFERAAHDPANLSGQSNWAICLIQRGQRREAEDLLRKVLTVDPNFKAARQNLERLMEEK